MAADQGFVASRNRDTCDTTTKKRVLFLYFVEADILYPNGTMQRSGPPNAVAAKR